MKHLKPSIYIDTSVVGGCFDDEFKEYSNLLFKEFINGNKVALLSDLLLEELEFAPDKIKEKIIEISSENIKRILLTEEALSLADEYVKEKILSINYISDCRHIALATIYKADVLVSWNFKHIVNLNKIRLFNAINLKLGYPLIEIRSLREVLLNEN
jgi:hypothetical protein